MTQHLSVLQENPYLCRYQVFPNKTLENQEKPFYFQLHSSSPAQQIVIFSKRLADRFRTNPEKVQDMANIVVKELVLNPNQVIWIEKCFHPFERNRPVFHRILLQWQDGRLRYPQWVPILEDWNLAWLENLTAKTITLNTD